MFGFLVRKRRLRALSAKLDRTLTGHKEDVVKFNALYERMDQKAITNGKKLKVFGSKPMTILHWIRTKHVYFDDGTDVPFDFYK